MSERKTDRETPPATSLVESDAYDSGEVETLPDGSISIPILEEELVVTKRVVVRERLIVHKDAEVEHRTIGAELRRERIEVRNEPAGDRTGSSASAQRSLFTPD